MRRDGRLGLRSLDGRGIVLVALLLLSAAGSARAAAIVPDNWPTIQQAIDSGAGEVLVRPGVYPETLNVHRVIDIKGLVPDGTSPDSLPVVAGLVFTDFIGEQIHNKYIGVWSLRFLSPVRNEFTWSPFWNPLLITLAGCALDGGLVDLYATGRGQIEYYLQRCTIGGPLRFVVPQQVHLSDCTVRAPITVATGLDYSTVKRCDFRGPYPFAIDILSGDSFEITDCTFEGFETPIRYRSTSTVYVTGNRFVGPGIVPVSLPDRGELAFHSNRVTGFQYGILVAGEWGDLEATRNVIEDCGTAVRASVRYGTFSLNEVRSCEKGVLLTVLDGLRANDNVVRSCDGDGMVLVGSWSEVNRNNVGGCGGDGIRLTSDGRNGSDPSLVANTVFSNGGAGLVLNVTGPTRTGRVHHNIAYANKGYGLMFSGPGSIALSCNDWHANVAGAVSGAEPGATDFALDPLFCDVAQGDVHLRSDSPLLNAPGCGLIGALGQGCEPPVEIAFQFTPGTLNAASNGRWVTGELELPAPFSTDAIDVASVRLNGVPVDPDAPTGPGGHGRNAHRALTVRFDRVAVARTLSYGDSVTVVVTGKIGDRSLHGTDFIRVQRGTGPIAVDITHESSAGENSPALSVRARSFRSAAGGQLTVEFVLPSRSPARLDLLDVAGRVMTSRQVDEFGPGRHTLELAPERALPQGMYFVRLTQAGRVALARTAVLR